MLGESNSIISRLFQSFDDLDQAIQSARTTLEAKKPVPQEVMERLQSYDGILAKQRALANELCVNVEKGDWDQVTRNVGLINGLSSMIRDDARAILSAISLNSDYRSEPEEINFC